jgi:hypothetical protein
MGRVNEAWFKILFWMEKKGDAERMGAQILHEVGYTDIRLIHPGGGPDRGADATCTKDADSNWIMACYFPFGPKGFAAARKKLKDDIDAALEERQPTGLAFVTNQPITDGERTDLGEVARGRGVELDLFDLERTAHIIDRPNMVSVREQYLDIPASMAASRLPDEFPEVLVQVEILGAARFFTHSSELREIVAGANAEHVRKRETKLRADASKRAPALTDFSAFMPVYPILGRPGEKPKRTKPWTDDEIDQHLATFDDDLTRRWDKCCDYLAAVAWPGLSFRIANEASIFLRSVQVIFRFHDAKGVPFEDIAKFEWEKLQDPSWTPYSPYGMSSPQLSPRDLRGYPVHMQNDGADLVVTIDLQELRPVPVWQSNGSDVVLIARDPKVSSIAVSWTVTAEGYNGFFEGPPIHIPVESVDACESTRLALQAAEE